MRPPDYQTIYFQPTYATIVPQWLDPGNNTANAGHFKQGVTKNAIGYINSLGQFIECGELNARAANLAGENVFLNSNKPNGLLSQKAQRNIKNAVNWLLLAAPNKRLYQKETGKFFYFKLNLITLTLPSPQGDYSDTFIKSKLLAPWLQYAKYKFALKNYVWKAEAQKNGNIHFHITCDTFIHYKSLRNSWNKQLSRYGFIDTFESSHGHRNPNSTDVHAVKKVKNLGAYLCKYLAKNEKNKRPVEGKLWSCSYNLSCKNKLVIDSFDIPPKEQHQLLNHPDVTTFSADFFDIMFFQPSMWKSLDDGFIKRAFYDHLAGIRHDWQANPPLIAYSTNPKPPEKLPEIAYIAPIRVSKIPIQVNLFT